MARQGNTTRLYATGLQSLGWSVLYKCIPNTAHINVVPIMTSHGVSKQRYPDIAALKENTLLLVEVEMSLSESVTTDILLRFKEMRTALQNPAVYDAWANKVTEVTAIEMPVSPTIEARLLVVNAVREKDMRFVELLRANQIEVVLSKAVPLGTKVSV